jgi:RNA polymerase sigma-70 factor (ECF subfamily)
MANQSQTRPRPRDPTPTVQNAPDEALMVAAKRDRAAFGPLYQRYVDPVYRYAFRRLGSREAAEDATALVFTKALTALPTYRDDGPSFRSWLFAIAHNVLVDLCRGRHPAADLQAAGWLADPSPGPEETALATEGTAGGPGSSSPPFAPDQRRVMELRLAGLTTVEVAAVLGRSPGAIRATQFRAATRLRELVADSRRGVERDG